MLEVRLIGKFAIRFDGKPVIISSRIAQSLFAYLILTAGTLHRREKLAGMFWPDATEAKARAYLRHELWRIRKAVPPQSKVEYLIADAMSISFDASAEYSLDVTTLTKVSENASIAELTNALSVFQGELLPGFYEEWITQEREHLQAVYEKKIARLLELLEKEKRWNNILEWAERWISYGQGSEEAYRALMFAYDALGDRAKVASTYERCVQAFRALDLEPSEETHALAFKRTRNLNIPIPLTSFIGREKELKEVASLFSKSRLVTLTGSGGVGKTRLAIQVVADVLDRFPDGVWFLDLAPLSDPMLVSRVVATTLGLIEQAGRSPIIILTDFLHTRRALLILDNCEHLIQTCAQLVETLLQSCPDLRILTTSRESLRIGGEFPYRVPSLEIPKRNIEFGIDALSNMESVKLFMERAQVALPSFALSPQDTPYIVQICQRLDGIPLAIELAAARSNMLTVEQILKRLDDRFTLLTGGLRTSLPRHQTLRATIEWSYGLLSEQERILFRRLAVFAGGWSLEAAEEVCSGIGIESSNVLEMLSELVNKSLVEVQNLNGEIRYRRLETIRQFAREELEMASEVKIVRQRHLAYFVDLAERAEPNLRSFDTVMWLDRFEEELDNIRVALDWAQESNVEMQLRLASALLWFWHIRGYKNEGIDWLNRGLSIEELERGDQPLTPSPAIIRGKALNAGGVLMALTFKEDKSAAFLEESLALFEELGPTGKQGMAYALSRLGGLIHAGNQGRSMLEKSLKLFREIGDKFGIAECLTLLVSKTQNDNDFEQAVVLAEEQLALRREIGDQDGIATALGDLGGLYFFVQHDYQRAIALLEESLAGFRTIGNKWAMGYFLSIYGDVCLWQGDYEQATKIYEEAVAFAQDIGERLLIAINSYSLGAIAWFQGDYERATRMITDSLTVFRDVNFHWLIASSLHALGDIALGQGDEKTATQKYEAELAFGREAQLNESIIFALGSLGKIAWSQGDYDLAEEKFDEVLSMSREAGLKTAISRSLHCLGRVAQSRGDYSTASTFYLKILGMQQQRINFLFNWSWLKTYGFAVAYSLGSLAVLATKQKQMERAACLFSTSENLYTPLRFEMSAKERAEHDQAIAAAQAVLGEEVFADAWEQGKQMTLNEAIAYALEKSP